jgi:hypothetical protein
MKKHIIFLFGLCAFISVLQAQENEQNWGSQLCGTFSVNFGYGNMDVSNLQGFVPQTYRVFNNDQFALGVSAHIIVNRYVMGINGFGIKGDRIKNDSTVTSLGGNKRTIELGYVLLEKKNLSIYPMIGIGMVSYGVNIVKNKNVSVGEILLDPGQGIDVFMENFVADLSLNLNLYPVLVLNKNKQRIGGVLTGLRIGYLYSLPNSIWFSQGGDVLGGPNFGMNMFYLKIKAGGFFSKNKPEFLKN